MRVSAAPAARPRAAALAAALVTGLAAGLLGACGGSLYDARGVPPLPADGPACAAPQHVCAQACVAQSVSACGGSCAACAATDPNASPTCEAGAGGAYACGQACHAGWLACAGGCCRATAVAAGDEHACAITSDGGLLCWGKNDAGQLGPAAAGLARSVRPVAVFTGGVTAAAAGGRHTCAVQGGTVRCWGANDAGQLGDGTTAPRAEVVSTGLAGATALALGARHGCAVTGAGAAAEVSCWGANDLGQLGTGDIAPHAAPVPSLAGSGVTALAAAGDLSCAVAAGAARCWGVDLEGQTGSGDTSVPRPPRPIPVTVPLPGPVERVAAGGKHACASVAVAGVGTPLHCWGSGGEGEMGNRATVTPVLVPVQADRIDNGQAASVFAAGEAFTCSSKPGDVTMKCAGRNDQAQCGGVPSGPAVSELEVAFGGAPIMAAAGRAFTCALVDVGGAGAVKCWGANADGQLGRATPSGAPSPTPNLVGN